MAGAEPRPEPVYVARYRVWWSETDAAGIVHFTNFLRYCERAEEEWLRGLGFCQCPRGGGFGAPRIVLPRVSAGCEYMFPLWPGDEFTVSIDEVVVGNKSIEYRFTIRNETRGGRVSARCRIVAVAYDTVEGSSIPLPDELRKRLLEAGARPRER